MHKLLKQSLNLLLVLLNFTFHDYFMSNIKLLKINLRLLRKYLYKLSKCFELEPFISNFTFFVIQNY